MKQMISQDLSRNSLQYSHTTASESRDCGYFSGSQCACCVKVGGFSCCAATAASSPKAGAFAHPGCLRLGLLIGEPQR
jgi:hypothetical protein